MNGAVDRVAYRISMPKAVYEAAAALAHEQDRSIHMQLVRCVKLGVEVEQKGPVEVPKRRRRRSANGQANVQV
jgi:hypothetical protein